MLKKIIAMLLTAAVLTLTAIPAYAANIPTVTPNYLYTSSANSKLSVSNATATCKSNLTGYRNSTTSVAATQYLEKKNGSTWEIVSGGTWSDTQNGISFSMENSKSNLGSGTYRLKTVFTVYSGSESEIVVKTSKEVTI